MVVHCQRFNIYLVFAALVCAVGGCRSPDHARKKETAMLAVYLETSPRSTDHSQSISVSRGGPMEMTVEKNPFLTEAFISEAKVIPVMDGFALSIQFERRGSWLLEQYSTGNRGKRLAIHARFGKDLKEERWLAAPVISTKISNGVLTFTPDASREESDQIVLGLNNVAKKIQDKSL